ncbi:hypothetical protein GCM10016234_09720 [Tianweitania populi]|uniref:Uncharacterized protein n=1 Tax=Tianweitania populi TaxID=1607949 RepID=A0A8J3GJY4_9HYPH|nr:hypothetical protein GCM10016234_09720 [Tianweitania populi]
MAEGNAIAHSNPLCRTHKRPPAVCRDAHVQGRVYRGLVLASAADALQLSRNDLSIVEYQGVTGTQQLRQIKHVSIAKRTIITDNEHARAVTRIGWPKRYAFVR